MQTQTDQRLVLDLLETGKIDTGEADWLLEKIGRPSARRPLTPYPTERSSKVILEIDADEENLQIVIKKLSEAVCNHQVPDEKPGLFKRLTRRTGSKSTAN